MVGKSHPCEGFPGKFDSPPLAVRLTTSQVLSCDFPCSLIREFTVHGDAISAENVHRRLMMIATRLQQTRCKYNEFSADVIDLLVQRFQLSYSINFWLIVIVLKIILLNTSDRI